MLVLLLVSAAVGSDHPGNIFVVGEEIRITVPESWPAWYAVDINGKRIGSDSGKGGLAQLGTLPIGYYEVCEQDGTGRVTAGVIAKVAPSQDNPIALDTAISWFYADEQQVRDACTLCRLAGVQWVRDRLSWPEIEPARGTWADETRYERAMRIQQEAGLKVLQVNHISPPWANQNPKRFPEDLRDVYDFYRELARRWKDLVNAIEPWNEPDIELFGGHTGCEIASFQKAAYLGLKAGNPDLPVCQSTFAIDRAETLAEFGANEVHPYFDIYSLHHYTGMPAYPRVYSRHRAVSGGRPIWTSEFNLPVHWADETTKEPSEEQLRFQAYRVAKVFASALHEGTEKAFYFILGHYVERNLQYGLVHADLTPRPAYVALAAVGRLLNSAKPIGRVDLGDEKLRGYVFRTVVDGLDRETLIAWSETHKTPVQIPFAEKSYDYLGRRRPQTAEFVLTREPVFVILPRGGSKGLRLESPPEKPPWRDAKQSRLVLQLIGRGDVTQSAFRLDESRELQLAVYNFGEKIADGTLLIDGASVATANIKLRTGERELFTLTATGSRKVTVRLIAGGDSEPLVSANLMVGD